MHNSSYRDGRFGGKVRPNSTSRFRLHRSRGGLEEMLPTQLIKRSEDRAITRTFWFNRTIREPTRELERRERALVVNSAINENRSSVVVHRSRNSPKQQDDKSTTGRSPVSQARKANTVGLARISLPKSNIVTPVPIRTSTDALSESRENFLGKYELVT